ncbi:MAG TPA: nucleoside monophosphate kinase [Patescibacteria group bacterium]|nr:nucleoside monophosphate kinase [Patescibacteria group bacterium]
MKYHAIILIGPQGSGKGTQAEFLKQATGFHLWIMGQVLRDMHGQTDELSVQITKMHDSGTLVPDNLLIEVVKQKINQLEVHKGIIFDGVPRRLGQAKFLLDFLKEKNIISVATVFIDVPRNVTFERLSLRAAKEGRADDTPEKIEFRLKQYEGDTLPVLDYLKQVTDFFAINGDQSIEDVRKEIFKKLEL